jgi:hypothetical protein
MSIPMRASSSLSLLSLGSLLSLLALVAPSSASAVEPSSFSGRYVWTTNEVERVLLAKEVDETVATLIRVLRPIARPSLRKATAPFDFIEIQVEGTNRITYARAGVPPVQAALDGQPVKWEREGGTELNVAFEMTPEGKLQQTLSESDGTRVHLFSLAPTETNLTMEVAINSKRLDREIRYKLTYVKVAGR